MPKMTQSQKAQGERLAAAVGRARDALFSYGSPADRFLDCFENAPQEARDAFVAAKDAFSDWESDMVAQCRGYRGSWGQLISY